MKLVVGLGNPGKQYEHTRHNAGFLALEEFAEYYGNPLWKYVEKNKAELAKMNSITSEVRDLFTFMKPVTFMNESGKAVSSFTNFNKIEPKDILVVHDDMDTAPGKLSFKFGGGGAGHNGISSIIEHLGTNDFARLRIGIGRPTPPMTAEAWVLGKIEAETLSAIKKAREAIYDWMEHGTERAMNTWNRSDTE